MKVIDKWLGKEWVRWLIAGLLGAIGSGIVSLAIWSYSVGKTYGAHIEGDNQKWAANDTQHRDFKDIASATTGELKTIRTDVGEVKGKVDLLIQLQLQQKRTMTEGMVKGDNSFAAVGIYIVNATTPVTSLTGYGGSIANSHGTQIGGGTITTLTATGGSAASYGCTMSYSTAPVTVTTATGIPGTVNGAQGIYVGLGCCIVTVTATGGNTNGANAVYNGGGVILGGTATGGSVSGAMGIGNFGSIYNVTASGTTSGAYGTNNYGLVILDVRNMSGYALSRGASGTVILFGGTSQTAITGSGGWLKFIPVKADVRITKTVLEEVGEMNAATQRSWVY